jgi:N-acetylglucosamine-6-phosphate deacetylase
VPSMQTFHGDLVLPDAVIRSGYLQIHEGKIHAVRVSPPDDVPSESIIHAPIISPGLIDLHIHGGNGADFMDVTTEAFEIILQAHLRHGTTAMLPTNTVGPKATILQFLELTRLFKQHANPSSPEVIGAHFYGPYFGKNATGCHPKTFLADPTEPEFRDYLSFSDCITRATVAPELPGAEEFTRACVALGIQVNLGHSHCTFDQAAEAISWGASHVDHLFCAMSDRARLRLTQTYPMRGGLLEATLYFDELTTEVIADGKHLAPELMKLALKSKGVERLALVTDTSRAMDLPDGETWFGEIGSGEKILKRNGVGLTLDGTALASSVMGMDHMVRTMYLQTGAKLHEVIHMASLTPARIAGVSDRLGSLHLGKQADLVLFDENLYVQQVWLRGQKAYQAE